MLSSSLLDEMKKLLLSLFIVILLLLPKLCSFNGISSTISICFSLNLFLIGSTLVKLFLLELSSLTLINFISDKG